MCTEHVPGLRKETQVFVSTPKISQYYVMVFSITLSFEMKKRRFPNIFFLKLRKRRTVDKMILKNTEHNSRLPHNSFKIAAIKIKIEY